MVDQLWLSPMMAPLLYWEGTTFSDLWKYSKFKILTFAHNIIFSHNRNDIAIMTDYLTSHSPKFNIFNSTARASRHIMNTILELFRDPITLTGVWALLLWVEVHRLNKTQYLLKRISCENDFLYIFVKQLIHNHFNCLSCVFVALYECFTAHPKQRSQMEYSGLITSQSNPAGAAELWTNTAISKKKLEVSAVNKQWQWGKCF